MTGQNEREERFLERVQEFRERIRRLDDAGATAPGVAFTLERDLDALLMEAANLAREPLLRYMSKAMEAAAALAPSPFVQYPDPRKGAVATNPHVTPDAINVLTRMVKDYLKLERYATRFDGYNGFEAGKLWGATDYRARAFINDVVHLVDNPKHIPPKEPGSHE